MSKCGSHRVTRAKMTAKTESSFEQLVMRIMYDNRHELRIDGDSVYCGEPEELLCTIFNQKHKWHEIWLAAKSFYSQEAFKYNPIYFK
jgi:hypothetical protein